MGAHYYLVFLRLSHTVDNGCFAIGADLNDFILEEASCKRYTSYR